MLTTRPVLRPSYEPLTPAQLSEALKSLPGWDGDTSQIKRTVRPEDLWALLERVAAAEAELDHHTVVDLERGTVTFVLWSHGRGVVTDADVALAHRINDVVGP